MLSRVYRVLWRHELQNMIPAGAAGEGCSCAWLLISKAFAVRRALYDLRVAAHIRRAAGPQRHHIIRDGTRRWGGGRHHGGHAERVLVAYHYYSGLAGAEHVATA